MTLGKEETIKRNVSVTEELNNDDESGVKYGTVLELFTLYVKVASAL
jgi:hypothetical protein